MCQPTLVPASTGCYLTGLDRQALFERVENGQLLWVFDFRSAGESRRLLRFWCEELKSPSRVRELPAEAVWSRLLPYEVRRSLLTHELTTWASITRTQVCKLIHAGLIQGKVINHVLRVDLDSIREFLRARIAGGAN